MQEGLASPFQQKLGFLHKCFALSELTLQTLVYPFQFLRDKDHFLKYGHIYILCTDVDAVIIVSCMINFTFVYFLQDSKSYGKNISQNNM